MEAGKGYIEMSTVNSETIKEISDVCTVLYHIHLLIDFLLIFVSIQAITMRGGRFLEAPVSGNKKSAESGMLVILAAGDRTLYMDVYSCFEALGKKTIFLGLLLFNIL